MIMENDICRCMCHDPRAACMHFQPCCTVCATCQKNIISDRYCHHVLKCGERDINQIKHALSTCGYNGARRFMDALESQHLSEKKRADAYEYLLGEALLTLAYIDPEAQRNPMTFEKMREMREWIFQQRQDVKAGQSFLYGATKPNNEAITGGETHE